LLAARSLYSCSKDCVRVDGIKPQPFGVGVRLQQWFVLSPLLYTVYIRVLLNSARGPKPTWEAISPDRKTHFANNENIIYLRKMLIWWNVTYREKITLRKMSSPRTVVLMWSTPKKNWRCLVYMNLIHSHRRVDEGVTVGNCRMNRLFCFLRTNWYCMLGSSQHGLQQAFDRFCVACDQSGRKISTISTEVLFLKMPKALYSASERKCTAAGGAIQTFRVVFKTDGSRNKEIDTRIGKANE